MKTVNKRFRVIKTVDSLIELDGLVKSNAFIYVSAWNKPKTVSAAFIASMSGKQNERFINSGQVFVVEHTSKKDLFLESMQRPINKDEASISRRNFLDRIMSKIFG